MRERTTWALIGVKALRGRFVGEIPMGRPLPLFNFFRSIHSDLDRATGV